MPGTPRCGTARRRQGAQMMALCRPRDLELVFFAYYGATLPEDDAGRDNLFIMANHIANLGGEVEDHVTSWAHVNAPWGSEGELKRLIKRVVAKPTRWKADTLAKRLGLTFAMRTALEITTI